MAQELEADFLGDEWKVSLHTVIIITRGYLLAMSQGYVIRITGGNDKQGFPMKQGVLIPGRARLLLSKGHSCFRPRRTGYRRRKSVHGCIVDGSLSVLNLIIVKKGDGDIPGQFNDRELEQINFYSVKVALKLFSLHCPSHLLKSKRDYK